MNLFRARSQWLLVAVGCLALLGCGSKERVVSVSGVVTHKGQPVPGIVVSFVPEAKTETGTSIGETDESGKYSLTVAQGGARGAVVGTHKVWISLPRAPYVEKDMGDDKSKEERAKMNKQKKPTPKPPGNVDDLLKIYGNLDKSPLTVEVKDGSPIDLKLD